MAPLHFLQYRSWLPSSGPSHADPRRLAAGRARPTSRWKHRSASPSTAGRPAGSAGCGARACRRGSRLRRPACLCCGSTRSTLPRVPRSSPVITSHDVVGSNVHGVIQTILYVTRAANSKSESRNPKQIRISKFEMIWPPGVLFGFPVFGLRSWFEFRFSTFGFRHSDIHTTSLARLTIFMKLRSRNSRATAPKMRVPRGFLSLSISTTALLSNRT